jgi:hypothetical protein
VTDTNVFQLSQPETFADPLTEVLRNGARALLAQAVEAEVGALLSVHADKGARAKPCTSAARMHLRSSPLHLVERSHLRHDMIDDGAGSTRA